MEQLCKKYELLLDYIRNLGNVVVAFSGGVDSAFLLKASLEATDGRASACICRLSSFQKEEYEFAAGYCRENNIKYSEQTVNELECEDFCSNPADRCYICKKMIFGKIREYAESCGCCVIEGTNADDTNDYRPGMKALSELGIVSPLRENGFTKAEIRALSEKLGLPTWNKPSLACLSTRIPYGERITEQKLRMIENAETFLHENGFSQVRVRAHNNVARIEVLPDDFMKILEKRAVITEKLKQTGFSYVSLDLTGFRSGSMNEILKK